MQLNDQPEVELLPLQNEENPGQLDVVNRQEHGKTYPEMIETLETDNRKVLENYTHKSSVYNIISRMFDPIILLLFLSSTEIYNKAEPYEIRYAKWKIFLSLIDIMKQYYDLKFIPSVQSLINEVKAKREARREQISNGDIEAGSNQQEDEEIEIDSRLYSKIVHTYKIHKIKRKIGSMATLSDVLYGIYITYFYHWTLKFNWDNYISTYVNVWIIFAMIFMLFVSCIVMISVFTVLYAIYQMRKTMPVGASQVELDKLEVHKYTKDMQGNDECLFCLMEYAEGEDVIKLKCDPRHFFHAECAKSWFKNNATCPTCRVRINV